MIEDECSQVSEGARGQKNESAQQHSFICMNHAQAVSLWHTVKIKCCRGLKALKEQ